MTARLGWPALLTAAIATTLGLSLWSAAIMTPSASATSQNFCTEAWLDRYGQPNDNCAANDKHYNWYVTLVPREHSACVSVTTTTSKADVIASWTCSAAGGGGLVGKYVDPTVLTNGIIRNNTTGDVNHASGGQTWCTFYNCNPY